MHGSPSCNIDRTFTSVFFFQPKKSKTKIVKHFYRNPVCLAKEYKRMIDTGEVKNQSDLARMLGVYRARVCQVLSLLKLDDELIKAIEKLDDPDPKRIVTERMLRKYLKQPDLHHEHIRERICS
jgi:predicted regulator of amino acid metabolism with ACT domain